MDELTEGDVQSIYDSVGDERTGPSPIATWFRWSELFWRRGTLSILNIILLAEARSARSITAVNFGVEFA